MFGPLEKAENKSPAFRDIHGREIWVFGIVIVTALVMGIWPKPILDRSEKSVQAFLSSYGERLKDSHRNRDAPPHLFPPGPPAGGGAQP
jgi:NADH:ubiquinone oxidoreductase subunit 4 (subunit M)